MGLFDAKNEMDQLHDILDRERIAVETADFLKLQRIAIEKEKAFQRYRHNTAVSVIRGFGSRGCVN